MKRLMLLACVLVGVTVASLRADIRPPTGRKSPEGSSDLPALHDSAPGITARLITGGLGVAAAIALGVLGVRAARASRREAVQQ